MAEVMAGSAVQIATAINVHVYRNGDPYFPPKKCVVNPRKVNFDTFLNEVTRLVRLSGGAVRNIYTPTQGHRVNEVADLVNNCYYVAAGAERFKRDQYEAGGVSRMIRPRQRVQKQIRPVAHNNRIQVSARCRKLQEGPKIIHVYRNRDDKSPPVKLLLDKRHRGNMETVCDNVNLKVNLLSGQAVQRLYHLNGSLVLDASEIETGGQYVAAAREKFAKVGYGNTDILSPRGKAARFLFGRVPSNRVYGMRPMILLPKVRTAQAKSSPRPPMGFERAVSRLRDAGATRKPPPGRTGKPTPKPPARRPLVQKRRPVEKSSTPKKEAEGIPMRPAMVKRSREKDDNSSLGDKSSAEDKSSLDYSDDPNSVFKAKEKRNEVTGANEVQDSNDTKTELPIDQVAAEEVEEEDIAQEDEKQRKTKPSKTREEEVGKQEEQEDPVENQNNNHQTTSSPEIHLDTSDPPPVIDDEDIKPSSPPATPVQKSPSPVYSPIPSPMSPVASPVPCVSSPTPSPVHSPTPSPVSSPIPSPPQDHPNQSLVLISPSDLPSPNLDLPKSPSPDTFSSKSASPKPQSPQQDRSPSPKPASPLQPKPPSPKEAASPDKAESPQQSGSPDHRGSISSGVQSASPEHLQDSKEESNKTNSSDDANKDPVDKDQTLEEVPEDIPMDDKEEENQAQSPVDEHKADQDESNNQDSKDVSNDADKPTDNPSPEDKTRTPSPPKSPRKTPSRTRSVTPSGRSPSPPKEQIGNGHAHTEEVNA